MPLQIFKRPQAERDIEECFVYITEDNLDIAVSFLGAIEGSLEKLFDLLRGHSFSDRGNSHRARLERH